jgi:hypothetical protein
LSEQSLAYYGNRVVRPPADDLRRAALKRGLSFALVALIHLFFLAMLTVSLLQQQQRVGRKNGIETILNLSLLHTENAPPVDLIKPDVESVAPPAITTAPITIPPVKPVPEENAPAPPAGDVLKAIGEAIACGATNFENLTDAQRAKCKHEPWIPRKLPNGTIVLDAPQIAAPPEIHLSGAEQLRRDLQTAPPCPIVTQLPCANDILTGKINKPF